MPESVGADAGNEDAVSVDSTLLSAELAGEEYAEDEAEAGLDGLGLFHG